MTKNELKNARKTIGIRLPTFRVTKLTLRMKQYGFKVGDVVVGLNMPKDSYVNIFRSIELEDDFALNIRYLEYIGSDIYTDDIWFNKSISWMNLSTPV